MLKLIAFKHQGPLSCFQTVKHMICSSAQQLVTESSPDTIQHVVSPITTIQYHIVAQPGLTFTTLRPNTANPHHQISMDIGATSSPVGNQQH